MGSPYFGAPVFKRITLQRAATLKPATNDMRDENSDGSRRVQHGRYVCGGVV